MIRPENFIEFLKEEDISFFAGVPDSLLKDVCAYITDSLPAEYNIITANEGAAVAIGVGHYLATRKIPMIYMQNSGLGNAINPLLSLADEKVYSIPLLLMIGWRGEPNVKDEPQHAKQGLVTLELLEAMDIPYIILPADEAEAFPVLKNHIKNCIDTKKPHAVVIKKGTFTSYQLKSKLKNENPLCREEALKLIVDLIPHNSFIVSTTGKLSRELYEFRDERNISHAHDFLTVGSMGFASSIALGIAVEKPNLPIFCFDGDGAFIMHLGAISNIGDLSPKNFIHIVFNNGAHESVGGQPTLGFNIDFCQIAKACNYKYVFKANTADGITSILRSLNDLIGPIFIEVNVSIKSRQDLGRPKTSPIDNKNDFMTEINRNEH